MSLSLIGILVGLAVLITLAMRGWHIILLAPLAASIVCIFSDLNILENLTGPYMEGFITYAKILPDIPGGVAVRQVYG